MQRVRFQGLLPGSRLRYKLFSGLCVTWLWFNRSAQQCCSYCVTKINVSRTWYLRTRSSTSLSGSSVSWAASGDDEPTTWIRWRYVFHLTVHSQINDNRVSSCYYLYDVTPGQTASSPVWVVVRPPWPGPSWPCPAPPPPSQTGWTRTRCWSLRPSFY